MTSENSGASALSVYDFKSIHVRVVEKNDVAWFVASDVAKALGYPDAKQMTRMLDEDEAALHIVQTRSENGVVQDREVVIISESGLYHSLIKSRKPEAKPFRKWVTSEVLPAIRKTGRYDRSSTLLTASEQQTLSELVHRRVVDYGPNMGKALAEIWSRVHRKFRVAKYDQLPREQVSEVIAYIMAMEIRTAKPPQIEGPQPITPTPVRNYSQVRAHMDNLRDWAQRALPESARLPFLSNLEDLDRCLIAGWTEMDEAILHLSLAASVLRRWRNLH